MTGNRSLDEFAASEPTPESVEPVEESVDSDQELPERDVEPIESTYDWTPGGAPCAMCGDSVEERWRAAEGLVCVECKVW